MSSLQLTFTVIAAALILIGLGSTAWTFWRRRSIDRDGAVKAEPRNRQAVRAQNPPDRADR